MLRTDNNHLSLELKLLRHGIVESYRFVSSILMHTTKKKCFTAYNIYFNYDTGKEIFQFIFPLLRYLIISLAISFSQSDL